uniref:Solute carrier family 35 member A4 n=1 Tax=Callorhinchus milii TaxID=7868 RepID=A0A4W3JEE8_CALMI
CPPPPFGESTESQSRVRWGFLLLVSVLVYGSHAPLISWCKIDGQIPFSSSSVVVLIELAKLLVSIALWTAQDRGGKAGVTLSARGVCPLAIPALLYALNNNLVVHMQRHMDPSTFQVLSNLKIASTAVLYTILLHKPLSLLKWLALFLLMAAGACQTYSGFSSRQEPWTETHLYITMQGLAMMLVYCTISGLSAVFTERILKSQQLPLNLQNLFLYLFGLLINLGVHLASSPDGGFFQGYSVWVGLIISTQALNGLLMSVVMKYDTNITRLFVISCSMLVNTTLSVCFFSLQLTPHFLVAVLLVSLAIHLYYRVK